MSRMIPKSNRLGFLFIFIVVALAACHHPCMASDEISKLSLEDAVSMALGGNAQLQQAQVRQIDSLSRLRVAEINTTYGIGSETGLEHNPDDDGISTRVYGNISYQNLFGTEASIDIAPFGLGSERGSLGISVRHPLMKGRGLLSKKSNIVLGARSDASIADKEYYLLRQSKVQSVVEAYYRAVLAREEIKVMERALAITEEATEGARKRADAGLVRGIEVSRAEVRLAEVKNRLNLQRAAMRAALDRLMVAIGAGVGQTPELTTAVPEDEIVVPELSEAIKTALTNRYELGIYDERIANQERLLAMAQDELRPELNAVAGFNSVNREKGFISSSLYDQGSLSIGVELRLPLDKRISLEERDIAERGAEVLNKMRVYRMEEIAEEVRRAYRSVESARTTLDIFSKNRQIAEDRLKIAQRMVEEGLETNREVLDAQESLAQLESSLLSARVDLYLASINLKYAMGEDLTSIGFK